MKTFIEPFRNKKEGVITSTYFVVYLQKLQGFKYPNVSYQCEIIC